MRLALAALLLAPPAALAQGAPGLGAPEAPRDSAFAARLSAMWVEARDSEGADRDSLWRALAAEAWAYHRAHPGTPTGLRAMRNAFTMWGNTDAVAEAQGAALTLADGSPHWPDALHALRGAHARRGTPEAYAALLPALDARLTHPAARTQVLWDRGDLALAEGRPDDARAAFRLIVALEADSFQVEAAQGQLYELDRLALGMAAPEARATTLDGRPLALADLRGRVVVVDFWATWCGPCLPDIPHLVALSEAYGPDDLAIVGVSLDYGREELEAMIEDRAMAWAHVWEEEVWAGPLAQAFNVRRLPRAFVIDREGRIAAKDVRRGALAAAVAEAVAR